jgi:FkbM family methyltransferase
MTTTCFIIVTRRLFMSLTKKIKTALTILKLKGINGVIKVLRSKLDRTYRPDEAMIAYDLLSQNTTKGIMIDVGAHHGGSLAPFATAGWQIYAFEPDPQNRAKLIENHGNLKNVHIDSRAISDHCEENVTFFQSEESTGVSGLSAFLSTHKASQSVTLVTLAQFMRERKIKGKTIDFLKTDTEGFDLMAMKGYPWEESLPRLILCEFEDSKTLPLGYDFHALAGFLVEKSYHLVISEWYPVKHYGSPHDWNRFATYPCALGVPQAWGNIFAVRDSDLYQSLLTLCKI